MARSLNRVQLIGNLTRDPELRYTPAGTAVCSFGIATNRSWTTETGEKRDEAEFHRIVAWNKLAELCSQFLTKGKKVYLEGRLSTRNWNAQDGTQKTTTEIIISDMILLDSLGRRFESSDEPEPRREEGISEKPSEVKSSPGTKKSKKSINESTKQDKNKKEEEEVVASSEEVSPDDIPF
ncbi:MAG: single-stranded DNA-binding protein [Candidatus Levybacteria bacterium]|nr:single-stranded DNA-binding protein [Candidatus Levybacteria bacterium]